jgi:hypothetical protein
VGCLHLPCNPFSLAFRTRLPFSVMPRTALVIVSGIESVHSQRTRTESRQVSQKTVVQSFNGFWNRNCLPQPGQPVS